MIKQLLQELSDYLAKQKEFRNRMHIRDYGFMTYCGEEGDPCNSVPPESWWPISIIDCKTCLTNYKAKKQNA